MNFWVVSDSDEGGVLGRRAAERAYDPARVRVLGLAEAEDLAAVGATPVGALLVCRATPEAAGVLRLLVAVFDDGAPLAAVYGAGAGELPAELAPAVEAGRLVLHAPDELGHFGLAAAPALSPGWPALKARLARAALDAAAARSVEKAAAEARPAVRAVVGALLDGEVDKALARPALERLGAEGPIPWALCGPPRKLEIGDASEGGALIFAGPPGWAEALGLVAAGVGAELRAGGDLPDEERGTSARWLVVDLGPGDAPAGLAAVKSARRRHAVVPIVALVSSPLAGRAALAAGADAYCRADEPDPRRAWRGLRGALRGALVPRAVVELWERYARIRPALAGRGPDGSRLAGALRRAIARAWLLARGDGALRWTAALAGAPPLEALLPSLKQALEGAEAWIAGAGAAPPMVEPAGEPRGRRQRGPPSPPPALDVEPALRGLTELLAARERKFEGRDAVALQAAAPPAPATAPRVVVAADEPGPLAGVLAAALQLRGLRAELCSAAQVRASEKAAAQPWEPLAAAAGPGRLEGADLSVVVDEGPSGPWDLARAAREASPGAAVVLVTGRGDGSGVARAFRAGADLWISARREDHATTEDRAYVQKLAALAAEPLEDPERPHLMAATRRLASLEAAEGLGPTRGPISLAGRRALWLLRLSGPSGGLLAARIGRLFDPVADAAEEAAALAAAAREAARAGGGVLSGPDPALALRAAASVRSRGEAVRALAAALDVAFQAARACAAAQARVREREERERARGGAERKKKQEGERREVAKAKEERKRGPEAGRRGRKRRRGAAAGAGGGAGPGGEQSSPAPAAHQREQLAPSGVEGSRATPRPRPGPGAGTGAGPGAGPGTGPGTGAGARAGRRHRRGRPKPFKPAVVIRPPPLKPATTAPPTPPAPSAAEPPAEHAAEKPEPTP